MARTKKTYSILIVVHREGGAVESIDVDEGISHEELIPRLANKPEHHDYYVFSGEQVKWEIKQVIELGAARPARKPRTSTPAAAPKKKRTRAGDVLDGVEAQS